jgi:hypothetical protein
VVCRSGSAVGVVSLSSIMVGFPNGWGGEFL